MSYKNRDITKDFIVDKHDKILSTARFAAILLLIFVVGAFIGEKLVLKTETFFFYRLTGFAGAVIFFIYSALFFKKGNEVLNITAILFLHLSIGIMNSFVVYSIYTENALPPEFKGSAVMSASISVLVQHILGAGIKRWLYAVILPPAIILTAALVYAGISVNDMAIFSTYDIVVIITMVLSIRESRLELKNYHNLQIEKERNFLTIQNNIKNEFISNISHELRTPMTGIIGVQEMLLDTELSTEQSYLLKMARSSSFHLLDLINDLLDVSQLEEKKVSLKLEEVKIIKFVRELFNNFKVLDKKGIEFVFETEIDEGLKISTDSRKISQILRNLLGNAEKFTDIGKITLSVKKFDETDDTIGLEFSVADTGVGIPEEKIPFVFDRFFQADSTHAKKYGGTGLGLAITKMLVEAMGGNIRCESKWCQGSKFSFKIRFVKLLS
ncbi:MAG TPA: ATP-binding protein [bacterium]|nr:ATP-binding protein [bacterium]